MTELFYRPEPKPDRQTELLANLVRIAGRPHLAVWILEGADVEALKQKELQEIDKNLAEGGPWHTWSLIGYGPALWNAAARIHPEYFRTIEWFANQVVRLEAAKLTSQVIWDMADFVNAYLGPILMALKAKNKPWPQLKSKAFDYQAAERFVQDHADLLGDGVGPYSQEDTTVFDLGNGWKIVELNSANIEIEGQEMNNCLKDNDEYHWTDKAEGGYIAVLSLRDPLNRPHVSASVRYANWQNGSLVYTEGPLLKNNRPLSDDPEYQTLWTQFENHVKSKGGTITTGYDDWEEVRPEPYHADGYDTTEYGDYLSVEDLSELRLMWNEARQGCDDWGEGESEHRDDEDGDGDPYYYYVTYGGREVGSTDYGLQQAVEDWINDVETCAGFDIHLEMEPRDFVGAVVFWATMLQDAGGYSGPELLERLAKQISDQASAPAQEEASDEARGILAWASQQLVSQHSLAVMAGESVCYANESQIRPNWQAFLPPEQPPQAWGEIAPTRVSPEQMQVAPQPQPVAQPQAQPQYQTVSPVTRAGLVRQYQREWAEDPTPERLNAMGETLMTGIQLSPEDAASILQEVSGQQVGYREARRRMADTGSAADYPEDWFGEEEEPEPEFGDPSSGVPKFAPGEKVKFRSGTDGGTVIGEPEVYEGDWWYRVKGDRDDFTYNAAEQMLVRGDVYDKPGVTTINDWFGIPPEGEQYYRTAADAWDKLLSETPPERQRPFAFIYSPSAKWIRWTGPGGLHDEIENDLRTKGQTVPPDAIYGRYYPGDDNSVEIYGEAFHKQPWSYQRAVRSLVQLNAPDKGPGTGLNKTAGDGNPWDQPQIMYHMAPSSARSSILQYGLQPDMADPMQWHQWHEQGKLSASLGMGDVGKWYLPVKDHVEEEAKYYRQCPTCGGYLEKRGEDVFTCQKCPYELRPED